MQRSGVSAVKGRKAVLLCSSRQNTDDAVPDALQVLNMDLDMPVEALGEMERLYAHVSELVSFASALNRSRCVVMACTPKSRWQWAMDQAVYDAGCRIFATVPGELESRLPSDARYWALYKDTAIEKKAKRAVGMFRASCGLIERIGVLREESALAALNASASKRNTEASREPVPVVIGGDNWADCVSLAGVVAESYPALVVSGVYVCSDLIASLSGAEDRDISSFITDLRSAAKLDERSERLPLFDIVLDESSAEVIRDHLSTRSFYKECRVVLQTMFV